MCFYVQIPPSPTHTTTHIFVREIIIRSTIIQTDNLTTQNIPSIQ